MHHFVLYFTEAPLYVVSSDSFLNSDAKFYGTSLLPVYFNVTIHSNIYL